VMAETAVQALRLDRPTFDRLAEVEPDIVQRILERLALDLASRLRNSARYATAQIDTVLA
jgi:CRP-like cAMP-binding protein